jgi:hypothetical protein
LTNQKGIHGFWESRIPELKSTGYDYWVGKAKYIDKPIETAWNIVKASHSEVDSVLLLEKKLSDGYAPDKKYSFENRGNVLMKVYSEEYASEYNLLLNGMVERRMRAAIIAVGSLWYTAWVNAGKPDLNKLTTNVVSDSLKKVNAEEEQKWKVHKNEKTDRED